LTGERSDEGERSRDSQYATHKGVVLHRDIGDRQGDLENIFECGRRHELHAISHFGREFRKIGFIQRWKESAS
jgi:hypothetical protein